MISYGTKRASLTGSFQPKATGLYNLQIENTRTQTASTCIYTYIDNISLMPAKADFASDIMNLKCATGGTVNFKLMAGNANANRDYWIWLNFSGVYPGFQVNGLTVPLNWDVLLLFGLNNPGFPGTSGFVGTFNSTGDAAASMMLPIDVRKEFVGVPINFAYVVLSKGPAFPITYVSLPVHVKYIP